MKPLAPRGRARCAWWLLTGAGVGTIALMNLVAETYARRRFTADEVMRMVETGVLREDERVELLEGELVVVTPQGPIHSNLTAKIHRCLEGAYGAGHYLRDHSPVAGTNDSIPEPDVAVVRGDLQSFFARLPGPADVPLVVEVSQSTTGIDRRKADIYAQAGYSAYWLIDVDARRVEVRTAPRDGVYTKTEIVGSDGGVALPGVGTVLPVTELLP